MKKLAVILALGMVLGCGYEQKGINAVKNEWTDLDHKETWGQWADRYGVTWEAWEAKYFGQKVIIVNIEKTKAGKEVVIQFMYAPQLEGDVGLGAFKIQEKGRWIDKKWVSLAEIERFLSTGVTPEEREAKRKLEYEGCLKKAYASIIGKKVEFVTGSSCGSLHTKPNYNDNSEVDDIEKTMITVTGFMSGGAWWTVRTPSGQMFYITHDQLKYLLYCDYDLLIQNIEAKCQ